MQTKVCCITGHRKIDETKIDSTKEAIRGAVLDAIAQGYRHFISGFAAGVDLYFAEIVAQLKEEHRLFLEAAIPYRNRLNCEDSTFQRLIGHCDAVGVYSQEYTKDCFLVRNRFMVEASDLVLVVYDGRERGGTLFTMEYARRVGKEVHVIAI